MLNTIHQFVSRMKNGNFDDLDSTKLRLLEMQMGLWSNTMGCDIENNGKEVFHRHHETFGIERGVFFHVAGPFRVCVGAIRL